MGRTITYEYTVMEFWGGLQLGREEIHITYVQPKYRVETLER